MTHIMNLRWREDWRLQRYRSSEMHALITMLKWKFLFLFFFFLKKNLFQYIIHLFWQSWNNSEFLLYANICQKKKNLCVPVSFFSILVHKLLCSQACVYLCKLFVLTNISLFSQLKASVSALSMKWLGHNHCGIVNNIHWYSLLIKTIFLLERFASPIT